MELNIRVEKSFNKGDAGRTHMKQDPYSGTIPLAFSSSFTLSR